MSTLIFCPIYSFYCADYQHNSLTLMFNKFSPFIYKVDMSITNLLLCLSRIWYFCGVN